MLGFPLPPPGEPPYLGLVLFLGLTVLLILATLWTGLHGRRRIHVLCAATTMLCFFLAVRNADAVGRFWVFEPAYKRLHLWGAAYPGTLLALLTVLSGSLHLFGRIGRTWHRRSAYLFVLWVLLATGTALLMFHHGRPLHG